MSKNLECIYADDTTMKATLLVGQVNNNSYQKYVYHVNCAVQWG